MLLFRASEIFPGDVLGSKVVAEVERLAGVEDTVMTEEVCVWTEEFVVVRTGVVPEVDVKLTVVSEKDQNTSVHLGPFEETHTHTYLSSLS